jgi:hypothetical protein
LGYEEVSEDRGYINVGGRDLGMEGTTRGRENARKIFERETPDYRLKVKVGKKATRFEDEMEGREECRILTGCWREKKKNTEKKERETSMPVNKWKD